MVGGRVIVRLGVLMLGGRVGLGVGVRVIFTG